MPTATILMGGDGFHKGWLSIVGAAAGWQAVENDDADTSYIVIQNPGFDPSAPSGQASFVFSGLSNIRASQVRIVTTHKRDAGFAPQVDVGLLSIHRYGGSVNSPVQVNHPDVFISLGFYQTHSRAFDVNPFNGQAWQPGDFNGLQAWVNNGTVFATRITRLAIEAEYDEPTNTRYLH